MNRECRSEGTSGRYTSPILSFLNFSSREKKPGKIPGFFKKVHDVGKRKSAKKLKQLNLKFIFL